MYFYLLSLLLFLFDSNFSLAKTLESSHVIKKLDHTNEVKKNGLWTEELKYIITPNMLAENSIKLSFYYHSLLEVASVKTSLPVTLHKVKDIKHEYYVKSLNVTVKPIPIKDFQVTFRRVRLATDEVNHYSSIFPIEYDFPIANYKLKFSSQIPLRAYVRDNSSVFEWKNNDSNSLELVSTGIVMPTMLPGPLANLSEKKVVSQIEVSSAYTMSELIGYTGDLIQERMQEPLPASFLPNAILSPPTPRTQEQSIQDVIEFVQSSLKYTLDWETIEDVYRIKSFAELEQTRKGSCKEYSILAVRLLNKLGIKAYATITTRDLENIFVPKLPTTRFLNHMMVFAKTSDGKEWWIDPIDQETKGIPRGDLHGQRAYIFKSTSPLLISSTSIPLKEDY